MLVGHDGPHHLNIAEGKPVLRSLKKYHGKPGSGASVEFSLKERPDHHAEHRGDGRRPVQVRDRRGGVGPGAHPADREHQHARGFFKPDVRSFLKRWVAEGPTHHFALGVGHHGQALARLAGVLGIECAVVTPPQEP